MHEPIRNVSLVVFISVLTVGCSDGASGPGLPGPTGGAPTQPSGGASGAGMLPGAGQGGTAAGSTSTGGSSTVGQGGSTAQAGMAQGGMAQGGMAQGGMAQGGSMSQAGMAQGGGMSQAGMSAGGKSGGGAGSGGDPPSGDPDPSPGCGMASPTACVPCMSNGRPFYVDMPDNYDAARPYPVVFQYHPLGGTAQQARNMYGVRANFPNAIYVSPEGSNNGFPNGGGVDEKMTLDIMADIEARLCIDRARYFATGFSYGGSMSLTAACNMSDKFRAIAAMAGSTVSAAGCTRQAPARPVAVLAIHGESDTVLRINTAESILRVILEKNGCSQQTQPSALLDSACRKDTSALDAGEYQGCMPGYPVVWCPIPGYGHNFPMWSRGAIANFFKQF